MRQLYSRSFKFPKILNRTQNNKDADDLIRHQKASSLLGASLFVFILSSLLHITAVAQITAIDFDDRSGADNQAVQDNSIAGKWLGLIDVAGGTTPYTLELVDDGSTDNNLFTISGDSVFAAQFIDFETLTSPLSIRIQATDAADPASVFEETISIGITDVDESAAGAQFGAPSDEFQVNPSSPSTQTNVAVAENQSGAYVIVWQDQSDGIFAQRYNAAGNMAGEVLRVDPGTVAAQAQIDPDVAVADDGSFVVVWQGSGNAGGNGTDVIGRLYANDGTPGTEFIVNTQTTGEQTNPQVAMNSTGAFVVTWQGISAEDADGGVYARRYQADGTATDASQLIVNVAPYTGIQQNPTVGIASNGAFAVAWDDNTVTSDIYYQFYDAAGAAGAAATANNEVAGSQILPDLSMRENGAFMIAWQGQGTSDTDGIFAQRFNNTGGFIGNQFMVNTTTVGNQFAPSIAFAEDGTSVITYTGQGSGNEIFARRFNEDQTPIDNPFEVNRFRVGTQRFSDVAVDNDGGFIVAWETQVTTGYNIFARRYYTNEAPTLVALDDTDIEDASAIGTAVGTFSTTDPDEIGPFGYALVDAATNPDNASFAIEGNQLVTAAAIDQSAKTSYTINVRSTDGFGLFTENTFTINVVESSANTNPAVAANNGLTVAKGDTVIVATAALQVTDTESAADAITYTLVQVPVNGSLQKSETALVATETFTQADIDGGLIIYVHNDSETTADSLTFTAADASGGVTAETQVNILITTSDAPVANAGPDQVITDENGDGMEEVTLDGSASTDDGTIGSYVWIRNDTDTLATEVNPTITLTVGTNIIALVVTDDEMQTASDTVVITINDPVSNTMPILATNAGLNLAQQGATATITSAELEATDEESAPEAITFTLTQVPVNGVLQLSGTDLAVAGTFTQKDINDGLLSYVNSEASEASDSVEFTVADAEGGAIPETTFSISINVVTGLGDEINGEIVVVYPNPSQELLYIKMKNNFDKVQIDVSNNMGKLLKSVHLSAVDLRKTPVDISDLTKGTYFVRIQADQQTVVRKLIKE